MDGSNNGVGFRPAGVSTTADRLGFSGTNVSMVYSEQSEKQIPIANPLIKMACWGQRRIWMTDSRRQRGGSASNNHLLQLRYAENQFWMANTLDLEAAEDHTGCHSCQLQVENCGYN